LAAAGYGGDKAIFGYGTNGISQYYRMNNLVSNTGVVSSDSASSAGTARSALAGSSYSS